MAKKQVQHIHSELFFVSLVAVVILSAFVVVMKYSSHNSTRVAQVEGVRTQRNDTAAELMNMLKIAADGNDSRDFVELKNQAKDL